MTYHTYSQQELSDSNLRSLKNIAAEHNITPTGDKRVTQTWVQAILSHQSKKKTATPDEQTLAQAELYSHLEAQAQAVAPESLTIQEIHSQHFEIYAGKQLIAYITYDHSDYITQRWVVMVQGNEIFRHNTIARCLRYIEWHRNNSQFSSRNSQLNSIPESRELESRINQSPHHINNCELRTANCELFQDGTLPTPLPAPVEYSEVPTVAEISFHDQELIVDGELIASVEYDHDNDEDLYWRVMINGQEIYRDTTPARCHSYVKQAYQQGMLPVQQEALEHEDFFPLPPASSSENRIMAHIFNECQKYGFDILDDGIYHNDTKLGQVGCTNGNWWVIQGCSGKAQYSNSAFDAVRALIPLSELDDAELDDCEQLLDLPFDMLTAQDWQRLLEYEPDCDLAAA